MVLYSMKTIRIYVDTSVLGGCFDPEFSAWSNALMGDFRNRKYVMVLSGITAAEIDMAPEHVQKLHGEMLSIAESLSVTHETMELLAAYEQKGVLGPRFRNDMLHIAVATTGGVDVLVSWNFRHIVRFDKIQLFNGINIELGYKPIAIYSPREVASYEREE